MGPPRRRAGSSARGHSGCAASATRLRASDVVQLELRPGRKPLWRRNIPVVTATIWVAQPHEHRTWHFIPPRIPGQSLHARTWRRGRRPTHPYTAADHDLRPRCRRSSTHARTTVAVPSRAGNGENNTARFGKVLIAPRGMSRKLVRLSRARRRLRPAVRRVRRPAGFSGGQGGDDLGAFPRALSTVTEPPIAFASSLTTARPVPTARLVR